MWRSEDRLEFWLRKERHPKEGGGAWLKRHLHQIHSTVSEQPLHVECRIGSASEEALRADAIVRDGLDLLQQGSGQEPELMPRFGADPKVRSADLMRAAAVRRLAMPDAQRTRIRQERLLSAATANAKEWSPEIKAGAVGSMEPIRSADKVCEGASLLIADPAIRTEPLISDLPHRRSGQNMEFVGDDERRSFLHETNVMKHIPPERAELLALFRHVPIEMISKLRFLANSREILYSIRNEPKRTQARVHDMAAVRDIVSREVHLVPHRTQSRVVVL